MTPTADAARLKAQEETIRHLRERIDQLVHEIGILNNLTAAQRAFIAQLRPYAAQGGYAEEEIP
jgi:hypothetical protein